MKSHSIIRSLAPLLAIAAFAGCGSPQKDQDTKLASQQKPEEQTKEEYVRYTPTGSWITKKVKKSEATTTEQDTAEAQRSLDQVRVRGSVNTIRDGG